MLYNSFIFLLFFPIAVLLYWLCPGRIRNAFLLVVSYVFYMNWEPTYALLLAGVTLITYWGALKLDSKTGMGKIIFLSCLVLTFSPLVIFKYLNFISESIWGVMEMMGIRMVMPHLELLLPIGISFYTFQAAGYLIDVYQGRQKAEKNLLTYATFTSMFFQLAAGPIGRAPQLIPQIQSASKRRFCADDVVKGLKWMLWGYFMKVAVADRLALYTSAVFGNIEHHSGISMLLAAVFFSIQIYCDFAGYSFIALGVAKCMGYDVIKNFERPYMAQSVGEFWRRWHISLSTWFRDYVYFPLGGSRCGAWRNKLNLMITFLVSGLWHGANWTFVIWGGLNGLFQVVEKAIFGNKLKNTSQGWRKWLRIAVTFVLMTVAWTFFKANTLSDACMAVSKMVWPTGNLYVPQLSTILYCLMGIAILLISDVWQEAHGGKWMLMGSKYVAVRYAGYLFLTLYLLMFGVFDGGQFIYFQF